MPQLHRRGAGWMRLPEPRAPGWALAIPRAQQALHGALHDVSSRVHKKRHFNSLRTQDKLDFNMQAAIAFKAPLVRPAQRATARPQRAASLVVRSAPKSEDIQKAIKEAEDTCAGGASGEW